MQGGWKLWWLLAAWCLACGVCAGVAAAQVEGGGGEGAGAGDGGEAAGAVVEEEAVVSYEAVVQGAFSGDPLGVMGELYTGELGLFDGSVHYEVELAVSEWGVGLDAAVLSRHFDSVPAVVAARRAARSGQGTRDGHFVVQEGVDGASLSAAGGGAFRLRAFGVIGVEIDGVFVNLFGSSARGRLWRAEAVDGGGVRFVAEIVREGGDAVVARVVREWVLEPGEFHAVVRQRFVNLTDAPMDVRWVQEGPVNLKEETGGYRIELRRVRAGAVDDVVAQRQGAEVVVADGKLRTLRTVMREWAESPGLERRAIWESDLWGSEFGTVLSWVGQTDRYFLSSAFALDRSWLEQNAAAIGGGSSLKVPLRAGGYDLGFGLASRLEPWGVYVGGRDLWTLDLSDPVRYARMVVRMGSRGFEVGGGEELVLDFGVYVGPLDDSSMEASGEALERVGLREAIEYNLGGFAACCTFPWLGEILLVILRFFHGFTLDWAVSIVLLVVLVRAILHPITKKSQVSLMRFGKQMQELAPKQKKLQERYKDDPQKMRQEVQKLMREEGVNPAGALGCLPMFLQTPIWIALYAMLYMVFDLRHQAGFYGVFQGLTGGNWYFLADLSRGDSLIPLPQSWHFEIPLMGIISAVNVLPLLMGVLFFIQQKYMTPPPSAQMSPEMQTQQKLIKVMLVVMMPIFMYNAPAALTLYFLTNSTLGILESRYIRSHVKQIEDDLEEHGVKTVRELKKRKKVANSARPLSDTKRFKDRG